MKERPEDVCVRPARPITTNTHPMATPIWLTSVWSCESTEQADQLLGGQQSGYVYQREAHPNGDLLAETCRELHDADVAITTASGMSALAATLLLLLERGDHVVASRELYGGTLKLLNREVYRLGIDVSYTDTCDLVATAGACNEKTRLLIAETIANPMLNVADIAALATIARDHNARLLIDNTFATPIVCRPLELGADIVMESMSKLMNGHSDVMLGLVCGNGIDASRMQEIVSTWGFASSPFECWLASRSLSTLPLRAERASANALHVAQILDAHPSVDHVIYPGLAAHPHHGLGQRQFHEHFGAMVTVQLAGGRAAADRFIEQAQNIPFSPSLGEVSTTLSHPESTSHRGLSPEARRALKIDGGTIRLSIGLESQEWLESSLRMALAGG